LAQPQPLGGVDKGRPGDLHFAAKCAWAVGPVRSPGSAQVQAGDGEGATWKKARRGHPTFLAAVLQLDASCQTAADHAGPLFP
jgi:hypothetical protein